MRLVRMSRRSFGWPRVWRQAVSGALMMLALAACGLSLPVRGNDPHVAGVRAASLLTAGNHQRVSFSNLGGYAMLEGQVLGTSGGFIIDTGTPYGVFFNNDYVPLPPGKAILSGKAGGAQGGAGREQIVIEHEDVGPVTLGNVPLDGLGKVLSSNFGYIADMANGGLRPDFLGFVGLPLLAEHEFVFDYAAGRLDLYRIDSDGNPLQAHVQAEEVVAVLAFRQPYATQPHLPFTTVTIDGIEFEALLDNGTLGDLALTADTRKRLESAGRLEKSGEGWKIHGLSYRGIPLTVDTPLLRSGEQNTIRLGHNLLRYYRSVWNYRKQTVTLLR